MRVTLEQQEQGYSKITRFCQFEVRQYTREGQLEVSDTMREAMKRLRSRNDLFRYVPNPLPRHLTTRNVLA